MFWHMQCIKLQSYPRTPSYPNGSHSLWKVVPMTHLTIDPLHFWGRCPNSWTQAAPKERHMMLTNLGLGRSRSSPPNIQISSTIQLARLLDDNCTTQSSSTNIQIATYTDSQSPLHSLDYWKVGEEILACLGFCHMTALFCLLILYCPSIVSADRISQRKKNNNNNKKS